MKRACLALLLLFIAQPLAESGTQPATEDAKLQRLFKQYLDAEFKLHPLLATRAGNHDYDDLLDDVSPKARQVSIARTRQTLDELPKRIAYKKLTRPAQIDFEI